MESNKNKESILNNELLESISRSVGGMPTSSGFMLLIGLVLFVLIGHDSGIIEEKNYRVLSIVISLVFLYAAIIHVCKVITPQEDFNVGGGVIAHGMLVKHEDADKSDVQHRANHEAGHIIALAVFPKKPDEINAWISTAKNVNVGGRVSYSYTDGIDVTSEYLEASRLFSICPIKVEELILGEAKAGSDKDLEKWEETTKHQLNSFITGKSWFRSPSNEHEAKINEQTLREMLNDDLRKAKILAKLNQTLITEIATALILYKSLSQGQITSFVEKVELSA